MVHMIRHFYTSCHVKVKCAEFLFFETFLFSSLKRRYKRTWFLYVTSNKVFLNFRQLKQPNKMKIMYS